ncbi:MAG TPA: hypothetical protein VF297_05195 [Pyrinomonadaceae bacterium]
MPSIVTRAQEIVGRAKLLGPQTAVEMVVEHTRRLESDNRLIAESKAQFERGEICEEEVYEGDFLIQRGLYPVLLEVRLLNKIYANYVGVSIEALRERPETLETVWLPRVRHMLEEQVIDALSERTKAAPS